MFLFIGPLALNQNLMLEAAFADETVGSIEIGPQPLAAFGVEFDHGNDISGQSPAICEHRPCGSGGCPADGHILDKAIFDEGDKILGKHFGILAIIRLPPREGGRFCIT